MATATLKGELIVAKTPEFTERTTLYEFAAARARYNGRTYDDADRRRIARFERMLGRTPVIGDLTHENVKRCCRKGGAA